MTLPSLIGKWQKQVTVTQLKRTYTVLSQAVQRSIADNGDPSGWGVESYYDTEQTNENLQQIVENFSSKYIVPYLAKVKKEEWGSFADLGYKEIKDESYDVPIVNRDGKILVLNDGTVIQLRMSSHNLGTDEDRDDRWGDIIIYADINGLRGPNQVGKDIFMFMIDSRTGTGRFDFYGYHGYDITREQVYATCKANAVTCGRLILMDGWEIKEDYPWW